MAGNSGDTGRSVTSKVIAILETFSQGNRHSLTDIARRTGLPVSTVHRLASELTAHGMLERTDNARYRIGTALKVIGSVDENPPTLHERARSGMEDLAAITNTEVRLGVLEGMQVSYIERRPGHRPVACSSTTGRLPAHATALGKALLAFSTAQTVDAVIANGLRYYTPYTLATPDRLRRALAETRLTFVAVSRAELASTECAIAAPVFGAGGILVAALELKVRDLRIDIPHLQPALLVAARSLSRELALLGSHPRPMPSLPEPGALLGNPGSTGDDLAPQAPCLSGIAQALSSRPSPRGLREKQSPARLP